MQYFYLKFIIYVTTERLSLLALVNAKCSDDKD